MTDPEPGSKEQINAIIAAVTELMHSSPDDRSAYFQASARVLKEVPHDVHFHFSTHLVHVLLRELARAEGRGVDEVWRDIALILAEEIPEDEDGQPHG